jgi:hypothetical protein
LNHKGRYYLHTMNHTLKGFGYPEGAQEVFKVFCLAILADALSYEQIDKLSMVSNALAADPAPEWQAWALAAVGERLPSATPRQLEAVHALFFYSPFYQSFIKSIDGGERSARLSVSWIRSMLRRASLDPVAVSFVWSLVSASYVQDYLWGVIAAQVKIIAGDNAQEAVSICRALIAGRYLPPAFIGALLSVWPEVVLSLT